MAGVVTKSALTPGGKRLVELAQEINFGWIETLPVQDGEPILDPLPHVVRDIKFGGENGPRRELEADDFALKKEWIEFFAELDRIGNGTVVLLEIKHGLPFKMSVKKEGSGLVPE